jgi:uncharacterized membrane protein YkoI
MKKNLLGIFIVITFSTSACAQKLEESKVAAAAKQAFQKKFPGIAGKWEKENGNYEVNFKKDNKTMSAVIDAKGSILETETDIAVKDLPTGVEAYIKTHYKGTAITEAAQIVKANGEIVYEAEVNKKDVLFDANGKFIKEAKD